MLKRKPNLRPFKRSERPPRISGTPRRRRLLAVPATLVGGLLFAALAFGSVTTESGFQAADGNLVATGGLTDWNSFAPLNWTETAPYRVAVKNNGWSVKGFEDAAVSTSDTGFAGGVKQDKDCGATKLSKAPNKDDLKRIYVATRNVNGDVFLMISWVRIPQNSTTASAHVGYEFNQGTAGLCAGTPALPKRVGGDMLVVYDFEGGSGPPKINLSRWLTPLYNPNNASCEVNSSSVLTGCWGDTRDLTAGGFAEGAVNTTGPVTDDLRPNGLNPGTVEFGEAGINLSDANVFSPTACNAFGTVYAVSRSSGSSSQAAMMDLVGPGSFVVSNCGTVNVTKSGNDGGSQEGAEFTLYEGDDVNGTEVDTCTVNADGDCLPSFINLVPGTYTIDETSVPTGYTKDPTLPYTFTVGAAATVDLAFTNRAAPGAVAITKRDDANAPVVGATFTIYSPAGLNPNGTPSGSASGSCTTGANGTCTISGVTPGTYTIDESTVPAGYAKDSTFPKNITVTNGTTLEVSATDPRKFKMIVLVCRESNNTLYPSSVTINGDSRPASLSALGATDAGLSESALCGLTAGAKGGLLRSNNPQSAAVTIPQTP